jgi:CheY-like chemotaxis protein
MTLRVLVVDDETLVAENLQAYLEDEGMEVETVGSAEDAEARIHAAPCFDVCIMDLRLPGMRGDDAIARLRANYPDLPFIVQTGFGHHALAEHLQRLGIGEDQLFRKPLTDMRRVAETVRRLACG